MAEDTNTGYQVLARKYRPATFEDLIGQDAMVRTLKNAFAADRIAHAFVLTGIRGTGKTTTARIVAKGMNCIGPDGTGITARRRRGSRFTSLMRFTCCRRARSTRC